MKKIFQLIIGLIMTVALLLPIAACGENKLDAPANLVIDEELVLTWSAVPNARSYRLEITNAAGESSENVVQRTRYDLSPLGEGDYELRLRSVGGKSNDVFSDWSEKLSFHRDRDSGLIYRLINGNTEYEVRNAGSASGNIVIDPVYRGKPVTGIGETAFRGSTKITGVVIPDSVTYIGASAFYNCANLTSVTIPESVTSIGRAAFQQCSNLSEIRIPDAVTEIQPFTFAYCRSLKELALSDNVLSIGESAFNNCSLLTEFTIPDSVETIGANAFRQASALETVNFGTGLRTIGSYAFAVCNALSTLNFRPLDGELAISQYAFGSDPALKKVELPEGVTTILSYAFAIDLALEEVSIPDSVTTVQPYAFFGSKFYLDQTTSGDGLIYADNWLLDATHDFKTTVTGLFASPSQFPQSQDENDVYRVFREGTRGIADNAFLYTRQVVGKDEDGNDMVDDEGNPVMVPEAVSCENLLMLNLPPTLKFIGTQAFYHAPMLYKVVADADNSLERIGQYAFAYCEGLTSARFSTGLKEIGIRAFFNSTNLDDNASLIPDTVERIGENAFYGTRIWTDNQIADGIVYAGNKTWVVGYHIDGQEQSLITLDPNTIGVCDYAFYGDQQLQNVEGLNQVRKIGEGAFAYCTSLSAVRLNQGITEIKDYTFYKCTSLYSVAFPPVLTSIGEAAFYGCRQLHAVDLLNTRVRTIGGGAFRECIGLSELELGDSLESIGDYAFYGDIFLASATLPDTLTHLGKRAFGDCLSLHTLKLGTGLTEIGDYAFANCVWLRELSVPSNIKTIGNYAFYNCSRLAALTFADDGVTRIGDYAFYGNEKLLHTELPASLKSIGVFAFKGCTSLGSVTLKGTPDLIDENAFYGCPVLTIYGTGEGEGKDWSSLWNSSQRQAVWEVTLSEDGSYVESVTVGNTTYPYAHLGYSGPGRAGYTFVGWAAERGGTVSYTAAGLETLPAGTTVYSVWETEPEDDGAWMEEYEAWLAGLSQTIPDDGTTYDPQQLLEWLLEYLKQLGIDVDGSGGTEGEITGGIDAQG